jgi:hypothetical protein
VVYTTGGIDSFTTDNETDMAGTLSEAKIRTAGTALARHGPPERWVACSGLFMEKLNALFLSERRLTAMTSKLGMNVLTYNAGGITFNFFLHPLFQDSTETHDNGLHGHAFVIDPADMNLVTMSGEMMGFFKWFMKVQTPGTRERQDQLIANFGVKMTRPEHYGRWYNVD